MGAAFSVSEFINIRDIGKFENNLARRVSFSESERPIGFQLYGNNPELFLAAADRLMVMKPDFFDINIGCSVRGIAQSGSGAGLLKQPDKIERIFSLLAKHFSLPVTAKIRLGWNSTSINYLEICRLLEDCGAAMIAVHGRTAADKWSQKADWFPIAEIKRNAGIPIIGNGDVTTVSDISRMFVQTGCDGVMIGRAAIGNPWIFARREKNSISKQHIKRIALLHWEKMVCFYGENLAHRLFRKHIKAYFCCPPYDAAKVREILRSPKPAELLPGLV